MHNLYFIQLHLYYIACIVPPPPPPPPPHAVAAAAADVAFTIIELLRLPCT
jgi:hypothetical protein